MENSEPSTEGNQLSNGEDALLDCQTRNKLHGILFHSSCPKGKGGTRKRAAEKYPTREKRMKRFEEQLTPSRLKKKEVKLVGAILEGVIAEFMEDENVVESLIRNLHLLLNHPCAEKYAREYRLANSLLALTRHQSPDVVGCAWRVLASNANTWASAFRNVIQQNMSETTQKPMSLPQLGQLRSKVPLPTAAPEPPKPAKRKIESKPARRTVAKRWGDEPVVLGCVALDGNMVNNVKKATRSMKGAKFCDMSSESQPTHVIVGMCEPSIGLAMAVADGAFLLSMDWVNVSMQRGYWVAERGYEADLHLCQTAKCVRNKGAVKPLDQVLVAVHKGSGWSGGRSSSPEKLVRRLGGLIVPARSCAICVVLDNANHPMTLPPYAKVVNIDWLLDVALKYELPGSFWQDSS